MRKNPYYQCGVALNDLKTNTVRTAKFSSIGKLASGSAVAEENQAAANKEEAKGGSGDEDSSSNEDTKKNEVLRQPDYGYQERAQVDPEDDCFYKLDRAFECDFEGVESNMSIVHSRFAEVRRYYKEN